MSRLILCALILFSIVFSSCNQQIEGVALDNFGKPLKDVKVQVLRSKYEATTNSLGEYAIDYAAGEVGLRFERDGYLSREEYFHITEKQHYPAKEVRLTKIPDEGDLYIASDELSDYIRLKRQNKVTTKYTKGNSNGFYVEKSIEFYNNSPDSTTIIKLSSLDDVRLYSYKMKKFLLGKVGEDGKIARLGTFMFSIVPSANEGIALSERSLSQNIEMLTFSPDFDVDYVLIFENGFANHLKLNPVHIIFRFEKK